MLKDYKSIMKHTSIYALGNILSKMVGFFMIPIYTRHLTPADYGVLELISLVLTVMSRLLSLRLTAGMMRFYYEYDEPGEKKSLISTSQISMIIIAGLTFFSLVYGSRYASIFVFGSDAYEHFFPYIFASLGFELISSVCFTYIRILQRSGYFMFMSMLQLVVGLGLNIYLIVYLKLGVQGVVYSMVISNGMTACVLSAFTFWKVKVHFDFSKLKKLVKFGLPMIPAGLLIFLLNTGDRYLISRLSTLEELGIYGLGYKFGMLLGVFIGTPFLSIWGPKRMEIYRTHPNPPEVYARVFLYIFFVFSFVGLTLSLLTSDLLIFITTPEYYGAGKVVPLVVVGYMFYNLYYVIDIGFFIKKKVYWYPLINIVGVICNFGLNIILIPRIGAYGAAIMTAISFFLCALMALVVSQKYYPIKYDYARIFKMLIIACFCFYIGGLLDFKDPYLRIISKALIVLVYPVLLYITGFFEKNEITLVQSLFVGKKKRSE